MKAEISSRERTLAAINHEEADHVPIQFRGVTCFQHLWRSHHERVDVLLGMGADDQVHIGIEPSVHPDVTIRDWFDRESDTGYRLACREYDTPAGTLRAVMRCTAGCTYRGLMSDSTRAASPVCILSGSMRRLRPRAAVFGASVGASP